MALNGQSKCTLYTYNCQAFVESAFHRNDCFVPYYRRLALERQLSKTVVRNSGRLGELAIGNLGGDVRAAEEPIPGGAVKYRVVQNIALLST